MKIPLVLVLSAIIAHAQTNEFRLIGGVKSDITSPGWIHVAIPAGTALQNQAFLHFDGAVKPQMVRFQMPAVYNLGKPVIMTVYNFPYTPSLFRSGQVQTSITVQPERDILHINGKTTMTSVPVIGLGLVLNKPLDLTVWALSHPITNYDAVGNARITPARPEFDFGIPVQ